MSAAEENAFVAQHSSMIVEGPRERIPKQWKKYTDRWSETPLALKVVAVVTVILVPSMFVYIANNVTTAPEEHQRFVLAFAVTLMVMLVLMWGLSDRSVTPWVAMQLAVFGGTI